MTSRKNKKVKGGSCKEHGPKGIETDNSIQAGGSGFFSSFLGKSKSSNGETGTTGPASVASVSVAKSSNGETGTTGTASVASVSVAKSSNGETGTTGTASVASVSVAKSHADSGELKNDDDYLNRPSFSNDLSRSSFNDFENGDDDVNKPELNKLIMLEKSVFDMKSESLKYIIHMLIRVCKHEIKNAENPKIIDEIIKNINTTISEQQRLDGNCDVSVINAELAKTKKELTDAKSELSKMTQLNPRFSLVKTISETLQKNGVYKNDPLRFSVTKKDNSFTITPI